MLLLILLLPPTARVAGPEVGAAESADLSGITAPAASAAAALGTLAV